MFRAITAEEEAATGLLRAVTLRRYPASENIRPHSHLQKAAVYPFVMAIAKHASYLQFNHVESIKLGINTVDGTRRLVVALLLNGELKGQVAQAVPPLNFQYREGDELQPVDYRRYFLQLIDASRYEDILKYLGGKANERNLILYSSPRGLREFTSVSDGFLLQQKVRVLTIFKAALLIWPYSEVQLFATEAIRAFLDMTERIRKERRAEEV